MTSIDDLFKSANPSGVKRKLEPPKNPAASYKAAKHTSNGDVKGRQHASVEAAEDEVDDVDAGPQLPPNEGEPEEDDDDEEGRFFGGGVDRGTANALDYLDQQDDGEEVAAEDINAAWVRRTAQAFEKRITKNAELRAKFEDEPAKFMESEAELDQDVKAWSIVTEHTVLYGELVKTGTVARLVSLLAHENTDIALQAINILEELTDDEVQADQEQWDGLVDAMLEADLPGLLTSNLERLDEAEEADREGVYHTLGLVENLASQQKAGETLVQESTLLAWLLARIKQEGPSVSQNKHAAAEVLAILLQSSEPNRTAALRLDAVDTILQLVNSFRRRDPSQDAEEEEYAENLFDALACLTDDAPGKHDFLRTEGVELCLLLLRDAQWSRRRALKVLDHAAAGPASAPVCARLVDAAGLKPLVAVLARAKPSEQPLLEHALGILAALFRQLPGDSAPRIRLLAKFLDKQYAKTTRLLELRASYVARLRPVEAALAAQRARSSSDADADAEFEAEALSRRLDAGLFSLQAVELMLAWLVAEDGGARRHIAAWLAAQGEGLRGIRGSLDEQLAGLSGEQGEEQRGVCDMLETLVGFLE